MIPTKFNKLAKSNIEKYFKIINFVSTPGQYIINFNDDEMRISAGSYYPDGVMNNGFIDLSQSKFYFKDELKIKYITGINAGIKIRIYDLNNNLIIDKMFSLGEQYIIKQACLINIYAEYYDSGLPFW